MRLEITRIEGVRNDLLLRLDRDEIRGVALSVPHWDRLIALPGMPRHRPATEAESSAVAACKVPIEEHLARLGITGADGRTARRAMAISNRNLGANQGHVAWDRTRTPRIFRIAEDPLDYGTYSCLTVWRSGGVSIEDLRFDFERERIADGVDGRDLSDEVEWATFGQRVLRDRRVARVEEIATQFYDIRHVLAFDHRHEDGERIRQRIYDGYPETFRHNVRRAWADDGVPRARYYHNAVGLSADAVIVVQREGTIEEIGAALAAAGADDGVILDNGGSIACWAWWVDDYAGGLISPTIDYRPPASSIVAFLLEGPIKPALPGGSVSYSTY